MHTYYLVIMCQAPPPLIHFSHTKKLGALRTGRNDWYKCNAPRDLAKKNHKALRPGRLSLM